MAAYVGRQGLQQRLLNLGCSAFPVDGHYGGNTARAVRIFQRKQGLPETGRTDRETWNALYDAYLIAYAENERRRNRESRDR